MSLINIGYDASGNGNNWTANNLDYDTTSTGTDVMVDVPTNWGTDTGVGGEVRGNYATLNPLQKSALMSSSAVLSNGNLDSAATVGGWSVGTMAIPSSGKWYFEVYCNAGATTTGEIGILNPDARANGEVSYIWNGDKRIDGSSSSYSTGFTNGDTIGVAVNVDSGSVTFYKNNSSQGAISYTFLNNTYLPYAYNGDGRSYIFNFGQRPFAYTAPSGFAALCTQNLPDPTIADGSDYFGTLLWTGDGNTGRTIATGQSGVTGTVGFTPDFAWIKSRSDVNNHALTDVLRGGTAQLRSNTTGAEAQYGDMDLSFVSGGFSNAGSADNESSRTFVAWNWKANGSGVSNTAGDIPSTVSANTTAGFSIITYTGNGSANQTVGHGLGVAPAFGILKDRDPNSNNDQWQIFHTGAGDKYGYFTTAAFAGTAEFYPTSGSSTTVTIARGSPAATTNESGDRYVMYLFAPVEGYSAFGSYVGNGSNQFVYLGFRPRYVMVKSTSAGQSWIIQDSSRSPYNVTNQYLTANSSDAEGSGVPWDFLSNGFRLTTSSANDSGQTFIYMAFAENPFKYALAR